ncbi:MAG: MBL fold metallo-hydrolase [Prevotella sp.]|nr:MBL fold metallo-hydrolase [Prevotella sp.]
MKSGVTIKRFECNPLQENCYVVSDDETLQAVIIDCGALYAEEKEAIRQYIATGKLTPVALLSTHGHFDHAFGNRFVFDTYGLKARVHSDDAQLLTHLDSQCRQLMGHTMGVQNTPTGEPLAGGDTIAFGSHSLTVLHTPGHTPGGVVLWERREGIAFSGDTLFRMSVGRTDLPGGDYEQLLQSLNHIAHTLPPDTRIYPGHGPATNMSDELRCNPYLSGN